MLFTMQSHQDIFEDHFGNFISGIVAGDIDLGGKTACYCAHAGTLAFVPVSSGTKDDRDLFVFDTVKHLIHPIIRMGKIYDHKRVATENLHTACHTCKIPYHFTNFFELPSCQHHH